MKVHETTKMADKWKRLTGTDFRQFVEIMPWNAVLPDVEALEQWLKPREGESIQDALTSRYGQAATDIMLKLLEEDKA